MTEGRDDASAGYCNPPKASRYRKGRSGNPVGRPKGIRNKVPTPGERLRSLMLVEAYRPVTIKANGQDLTVPLTQAVLRSISEAAAKGEARAQALFLQLVSASELAEQAAADRARAEEAGEGEDELPSQIEITIVDPVDGSRTPYRPGGDAQRQGNKIK